ncbi:hypothetical protein [uncultured Schumannella sp.]|uniref:hypothetical protein n=1 Tax=uncultured Schumannella sp. TaxID=1195956 RepID=UPI0025EB4740|nr:hypothetical protein [uncultured Schumannella sp.]
MFKVTKEDGTEVRPGDRVTDFRGEEHVFVRVERGPQEGRSAKVQVEGSPIAYYATVLKLTVEELEAGETPD